MDDGYSGASLVTGLGLGLARALAAVALPLPALAAALAVVAGLAGLEGVDLAAVDLVDDARLEGMALKIFLLCEHPEQSSSWGTWCTIQTELMCVFSMYEITYFSPGGEGQAPPSRIPPTPRPFGGADSNAFLLYEN